MSEMKNILTEWRKFREPPARKRLTEQARQGLQQRAAAAEDEMDAAFAAEETEEDEWSAPQQPGAIQALPGAGGLATTDVKQALRQASKAEPQPAPDEEYDTSLENAFQLGQPDVEYALRGEPTWDELDDEFDAIAAEDDWGIPIDDEEEDPDDRIKRMLRDLTGREVP